MASIEKNNKGDKNNLYCFLSCVLSRLAYLKMPEFYQISPKSHPDDHLI